MKLASPLPNSLIARHEFQNHIKAIKEGPLKDKMLGKEVLWETVEKEPPLHQGGLDHGTLLCLYSNGSQPVNLDLSGIKQSIHRGRLRPLSIYIKRYLHYDS